MVQEDLRKPYPNPRLASRTLSGEAVVVDPATNTVRMLNAVGTRIWEMADGSRTVDQMVSTLTEEFDVEMAVAQQAVHDFMAELERRDLLLFR